jgi:hypothetical protein
MRTSSRLACSLLSLGLAATACDPGEADELELDDGASTKVLDADGKADASAEAVFLIFDFDGEVESTSAFNPSATIEAQLLYTIGNLNGDRSVGRIDRLELSDIQTQSLGGGRTLIRYHASLPVAWGRKNAVPSSYTLQLPRDMSSAGRQAFSDKYKTTCVDFSQAGSNVGPGNMWYYYRPEAFGCQIDTDDLVLAEAVTSPSPSATTGKFPEYHRVWEDDVLQVVAVFGKNEEGATSNFDAGVAAYNTFVRAVETELSGFEVTTTPVALPSSPGVNTPDIEFQATLPDGRRVQVNALLVDNVRTAGPVFDARYEALSTHADLIAYNGHAGLGANIRALASKGQWVQGQYKVVFMNGCDTFAYVDSALFDSSAALNPDDVDGTKYVDIVTNAMPAFFHQVSNGTMAMFRGLLRHDDPLTYEQIFASIDSRQVVLVSGEENNEFVPGGGGTPESWDGLDESGAVSRNQEVRFETPTLAAGTYVFELDGDADADLYVRIGNAPTAHSFDCRPFLTGSRETCEVELVSPAPIHVMVRGWASFSNWTLVGRAD